MVAVTGVTGGEAGQVVQRIGYSAYGLPTFTDATGRTRSGPTFGPVDANGKLVTIPTLAVAWQGLLLDLETGHSYNRARTLDHRLGRFLQRDPLGYVDGMSLYEYAGSEPLGAVDPLGLAPTTPKPPAQPGGDWVWVEKPGLAGWIWRPDPTPPPGPTPTHGEPACEEYWRSVLQPESADANNNSGKAGQREKSVSNRGRNIAIGGGILKALAVIAAWFLGPEAGVPATIASVAGDVGTVTSGVGGAVFLLDNYGQQGGANTGNGGSGPSGPDIDHMLPPELSMGSTAMRIDGRLVIPKNADEMQQAIQDWRNWQKSLPPEKRQRPIRSW